MMVAQEWNQALDSNGEPYVRHGGRKGLPAVWCMGRTNALSEIELRPSGTGEGTVAGVECDRVCGCGVCCSVKNVRSVGDVFVWNAGAVEDCRVVETTGDGCGCSVRVVPATLVEVRSQNSNTGLSVVVEQRRKGGREA
jgi:hypothetical protein